MVSHILVSGLMDCMVTEMGPLPFSAQSVSAPDSLMSKNALSLRVTPSGESNSTTFNGSALAWWKPAIDKKIQDTIKITLITLLLLSLPSLISNVCSHFPVNTLVLYDSNNLLAVNESKV